MFTFRQKFIYRIASVAVCLILAALAFGKQPILYANTTPADAEADSSSFVVDSPAPDAASSSNDKQAADTAETTGEGGGEDVDSDAAPTDNNWQSREDDSEDNNAETPPESGSRTESDNGEKTESGDQDHSYSENGSASEQNRSNNDTTTSGSGSDDSEKISEEEIAEEEESDAPAWNPTHIKYDKNGQGSWKTIEDTPHIPGKTNVGLCEFAYQAVQEHWGYARGTSGQTLTAAYLSALKNSNPAYYATKAGQRTSRWIGSKVADCSGLIKAYLYEKEDGYPYVSGTYSFVGTYNSDKFGIYSPYTVTGYIEEMPETPGIILHRTGHVGIYIGNGRLIEAKGVYHGVIMSQFNPEEWTSWAYVPCINYVQDGIYTIAGEQVCIADGSVSMGWRSIEAGNTDYPAGLYYFGSDGHPYTGIREVGGREYYFKSTGECAGTIDASGIVEKDGSRYIYKDDSPLTGWQTVQNKTYYFRSDGSMVFSMPESVDGVAYLFDEDGQVNTIPGYREVNGVAYYCDANGRPQKGNVDGILFGEDYQPVTGPIYSYTGDLILYDNGRPASPGFFCYQGSWYYINPDGRMRAEALHEGDRTYIFDENGRLLSQFQNLAGSGIIYE